MRVLFVLLALAAVCPALAGHDNIDVDRSIKRHSGQVTALGQPNEHGRVYSFQLRRLPAGPPFQPDELKGWRLTMLAGKRFANAFEVAGNGGLEITVSPLDGPLDGVAEKDVFVLESVAIKRAPGAK